MAGWLSEDPLGYSMFEMTSLHLQTRWHLWSSLINCLVDDTLWNARPCIDKALLQASCVVDCGLVGLISLLYHSPNTIVDWDQNFKSGLFDGQGSGVMYLYTWRSGATTSRTRWACRRVDLLEHESAARNTLHRMQHLQFKHHTHVGLVVAVKLDPWLEQKTLLCRRVLTQQLIPSVTTWLDNAAICWAAISLFFVSMDAYTWSFFSRRPAFCSIFNVLLY